MNQVGIFGRLTRDPELKYTQQGKAVANFSLAVNRFGNNNEADFFECVAWEKQAENICNSCQKGHRLLVWGRLQQDRWTDQQTQQNRSTVKIVVNGFSFIEPPPQQNQGQPPNQPPAQPPNWGQPGGFQSNPGTPGYVPPAQGGFQQGGPPSNMPPAQSGYQQPGGQQGFPNQQQQPPNGQYNQQNGQHPYNQPPIQQDQHKPMNLDDIPF